MGWGEENDKNLESWKEWILKPQFESNRIWTPNEEFAMKQHLLYQASSNPGAKL